MYVISPLMVQDPLKKATVLQYIIHFFILPGNLIFADSENENATLAATDEEIIETIAKLMGLDFEELKQVFLVRQINIRGNVTEIPLKFQEAKGKKHTLKK